jgi:drug/metabolite transporter (DMT)-like permease
MRRPDNPLRGVALLVVATVFFSLSDTMAKLLTRSLPVAEIAWLRYVAFVALAAWLDVRSGAGRFRVRRPGLQVLRGLGLVGSAIFIILALRRMPMAESSAISYVSPALITILAVPVLGETVGWRRWTAVAVGLLGVLVVVRPGTAAFQPAGLFAVACALCWAIASVVTRKISGSERATTTLLWSAVVGLIVLSAMLPGVAVWPRPGELAMGLALGMIASTGQYLMVLAYRHAGASLLAPFSYLQLIWATVLGWLVFGAWPDGFTLLGAAIIVVSGIYMVGRERAKKARPGLCLGPARGQGTP